MAAICSGIGGVDLVVLAAVTASPVAFSGAALDRFEEWWKESSVLGLQVRLGRGLPILCRAITIATVYFAGPMIALLVAVTVVLQSETLALVTGYVVLAVALIGIPVSLTEGISFVLGKRTSAPEPPSAKPLTFKMAVEQARQSPWLPVIAIVLLVVGAVLPAPRDCVLNL